MNRFSRGPIAADVQSNFIPLPIDAIARQIDRKQQQYDTTKAQLGAIEDTVLGVRGLSPDTETLKGIQNQYNEEILKGIEEVGGDYSRLGGLTDITARKLKKDLSSGHLAAIQSNYLAAQEHQDTLKKMRESKRIGDRGYNMGLSSISDFEGTKELAPGQYSRLNPYIPVAEESLSKMAQDRASADVEQYNSLGDTFRYASRVSEHTYNSLAADESAVSNAREEIRYKYGKLSPEKEEKEVEKYLRGISDNAANQRAFYKTHIPTNVEKDPYSNATLSTYDIVMANPSKGKFGAKGTEYTAVPSRVIAGTLSLLYKVAPDPLKIGEALDKVNWATVKQSELEQTKKNIVGNRELSRVFKALGKDPEDMSTEELATTLNELSALESSSRAGRISIYTDPKGEPLQRRKETASQLQHSRISIAETGEEVTDKKEIIDAIFNLDDSKPKALFSGEATEGYLLPGSNTYYLNGKTYVVEPPNTRNVSVVDNAIKMAAQTGIYKYTVGNKEVVAVPERIGDPTAKIVFEINGKEATEQDIKYLMGQ